MENAGTESYELWAWWESRREEAEVCAARFARMVDGLASIDGVFGQWRRRAATRAAANESFCKTPADVQELTRIFNDNRYHYDAPRKVWPELGFSISCWNGLDPPYSLAMRMHVGSYDDSPKMPNTATISISELRQSSGVPWTATELRPVMRTVIDAWDVREAAIVCRRYDDFMPMSEPKKSGSMQMPLRPLVGWLTYIAMPEASLIKTPNGVDAEQTAHGTIFSLCEKPFTIDNAKHMAAAAAMEQALQPIRR